MVEGPPGPSAEPGVEPLATDEGQPGPSAEPGCQPLATDEALLPPLLPHSSAEVPQPPATGGEFETQPPPPLLPEAEAVPAPVWI